MCLSTPTTTQNGNNTSSPAASCSSSPCNSSASNGSVSVCGSVSICSQNQKELDCNGNTTVASIKQRKTATATSTTVDAQNAINTKDLADNLGYKEENAVYKECIEAKEKLQREQALDGEKEFKPQLRYPDLIAQLFLHVGAVYGFYLLFSAKFYTFLWVVFTIWASGIGITAGAHRLWSHKSYNASLPLRILLIFLFTIAGQRDAYTWALDHRIHHKFSETEADPHNAKRGFFFAHVGWLFLTPHPKVDEKRKVIDMSDLENDGVVMFQRKWFIPLFAICSIGLPVLVPWYFWNEQLWISFWINFNMRFTCTLNVAFFVNSVAHMWGRKPYDKNISPVESPIVSFLALGEGWHNYHHVFPWDYKTGEFGSKSVSPDMVKRRALKCGDGTRFLSDEFAHKDQVWGYGDKDLPQEDLQELTKMKS
ncbi:hypothetical protein DOY81_002173 [Sarcophaga bullata]|nr:hypothetical protein DOY81_002173 [Sarcophaga bullata]